MLDDDAISAPFLHFREKLSTPSLKHLDQGLEISLTDQFNLISWFTLTGGTYLQHIESPVRIQSSQPPTLPLV